MKIFFPSVYDFQPKMKGYSPICREESQTLLVCTLFYAYFKSYNKKKFTIK